MYLSMYDYYNNEEDSAEFFFDNYNRLFDGEVTFISNTDPSIGFMYDEYGVLIDISDPSGSHFNFDIDTQDPFTFDNFMQVPITLEGVNASPSISLEFSNQIHLVWESNRDKNWNIFYSSSSSDKNIPFRFETQITDTESNSLSPDVSANIEGKRMIVWHDDRSGSFKIYAARALAGADSPREECQNNGILQYVTDEVSQFVTFEFDFIDNCSLIGGNVHFLIQFYADSSLSQIVSSVSSKQDQVGWRVNGAPFPAGGVDASSVVHVSYRPDARANNICGQLVFGKVVPLYNEINNPST
jgi:hypothetical protein